jgi:DNA-binding MarR family transcriptional regulator
MDFNQADRLNELIRAVGVRHRALAIAALAPFGIHTGHKLVLFALDSAGPRTQSQLAADTGFEQPTITLSVRHLEAEGLVLRGPSPTDRRATIVELTDKGRSLLPELKAAWCRLAERSAAELSATSPGQLAEVLADLAASLDAAYDEASGRLSGLPAPALPTGPGDGTM